MDCHVAIAMKATLQRSPYFLKHIQKTDRGPLWNAGGVMRAGNPAIIGSWLLGEEKMKGVMCGIDAVGYQARDRSDPSKEKPTQVLDDLIKLINPTRHLGVIGVFMANDPGASFLQIMEAWPATASRCSAQFCYLSGTLGAYRGRNHYGC